MAEAKAESAGGESKEHEGLAGTFREKAISLDTMDLRLLLPTAVAIALVVASAVLMASRDAGWPLVSVGQVTGSLLGTIPLPIALVSAITVVLAWSFMLSGALHAHPALRIVAVGAYVLVGLSGALITGSPVAVLIVTLAVFSLVAVAIGLYVTDRGNHLQAPHLHHRVRLRPATFGWILFATTLIYVVLALTGLKNGQLVWFIYGELQAFQFLLIPVLLLAGTDFAEWAEVVSGRVSSAVERLPRQVLLGAMALAAGCILTWAYVLRDGPGFSLLGTALVLAPVALLAVPVCGVGALSLRRLTSTRIPFWALAAGALLVYLGILLAEVFSPATIAAFTSSTLPPMVATQGTHRPSYSLQVPQAWSRTSAGQGAVWSGTSDGRPARLVLLWSPAPGERSLSSALGAPVTVEPEGASDGWQSASAATTLAGRRAGGEVWTRREGDVTWTLAGVRAGGLSQASRSLFEAVRGSFTTNPDAQEQAASAASAEGLLIWEGGAAAILLGAGLTLLIVGRGEAASGGLFLALAGLFNIAGPQVVPGLLNIAEVNLDRLFNFAGPQDIPGFVRIIEANIFGVAPSSLNIGGAYAILAVVLLTSIVPGWRLPIPILRLILVLVLGFAALDFLFNGVFGTALGVGEQFTVIQGMVLVVAMLWDVLMSGESFTNSGGLAVPRHTRVLLYMGYTLLVVTTVLFFSSVRVQGGGSAGQQFESDEWPQIGIYTLGPPLLITFFLVNLGAWRRARPLSRPDSLDQVDRSMLDETGLPAGADG